MDARFTDEWLSNIDDALAGRSPDYLVIHHMEPDHSANIANFMKKYPDSVAVSSDKAFAMMKSYFGNDFSSRRIVIQDGDTLDLGAHRLTFIAAPMVHWPEVMLSYEENEKILFSADAFGKFGANDIDEEWDDEARRYYIGIVGKYGKQVQTVLKKVSKLSIEKICPLHGSVLQEDLEKYIMLYDKWSSYTPEEDGIVIAYTSVYGNTRQAAELLYDAINKRKKTVIYDLARCDMSVVVADAFRYSTLVLATTTYNGDIFPFMKEFIDHLTERGFKNRKVAFAENGSWVPRAAKVMQDMLEGCELEIAKNSVRIMGALTDANKKEITSLADELCDK